MAEHLLGAADNEDFWGQVTTPEIKLDNAATYHIKTTIWCAEGERLTITALTTGEVHEFEYAETGFQTLEMDFTAGPESGRERLKFMDTYGYPFLIDHLQIMQDLQTGDQYYGMLSWDVIDDGTTESYTYTGLNGYGWEDFAFDIMAIHNAFGDDYYSVNSEMIQAKVPLSTGENAESINIAVYPNPANDRVVIDGQVEQVMVYDMKGALVLSLRQTNEVLVTMLPEGMYLLKIRDIEGHCFNKELVVKH